MTNPDHEHLDDTWLPRFTTLRMTAFGETVIKIANSSDFDEWTFSQKIAYAIEEEEAAREQRRFLKLLKASKSPNPHACVAEIDYRPERNLTRRVNVTASVLSMDPPRHQCHHSGKIVRRENLPCSGFTDRGVSAWLHRPVFPH